MQPHRHSSVIVATESAATTEPGGLIIATSSLESGTEPFLCALAAGGCAPSTVQAYRTDLSQFALFLHPRLHTQPAWGLRDVNADHVHGFVDELAGRGCKSSTISRKVASVRSYFRFLCADGVLESNPARTVHVRAVPARPESLGREGLEQALGDNDAGDFRSARDGAILEVLYGAGLRWGQLVGLNLSSLNMQGGTLRLPEAEAARLVPMGSKALAALASYLMCRADLLVDRDINQIDAGALFVNERGLRLHRRTVQRIVARGLPSGAEGTSSSPQQLRNSFATHLLDGGASAGSVQAMLGQTSLSMASRQPSTLEQLRAMYNRAHPRARLQVEGSTTEAPGPGETP